MVQQGIDHSFLAWSFTCIYYASRTGKVTIGSLRAVSRLAGWSTSVDRSRSLSRGAGWSNPQTSCTAAESRRAGWWSPAPGGLVAPGRLVDPRGPDLWLSPTCTANPTTLPSARRLSPAVPADLHRRPAHGGSVALAGLVEHRGPSGDEEFCQAVWSNPQTPCTEAKSRRPGWSTPAGRARRLSPAGQACEAPFSEAQSRWAGWSTPAA